MKRSSDSGPLLSVVTPVYNGAGFIAENVDIIREEFAKSGVPYELIVVSDGSVDDMAERALAAGHPEVRVLQYDRNANGLRRQAGTARSEGPVRRVHRLDLDPHPAELPAFLEAVERDALDADRRPSARARRSTT